jgi:hypothetical protein
VRDLQSDADDNPAGVPHPNVCEHLFVSTKGGSYARFRRALETGNLTLVLAAAAELPAINLDDALRVCVLFRADPSRYESAVIRWLGRLCLERAGTTITDLRLALAAFDRLPEEPEAAEAELRRLVRT